MTKCDCQISYFINDEGKFEVCPLHSAAEDLLEACKMAVNEVYDSDCTCEHCQGIRDFIATAIAKAEGRK